MFRTVVYLCAAFVCICLTGCVGEAGIEVGPYPIQVPVDEGALDPSLLDVPGGSTGTIELPPIPLCDLPSEEEVNDLVAESADDITAAFFSVSRIIADEFVLTATSGSFDTIPELRLFYEEPGFRGLFEPPVLVAESVSPSGFGMEVVLVPEFEIDLLDVIRERDEDSNAPCPNLILEVTGTVPERPITWYADLFAAVYGRVGI